VLLNSLDGLVLLIGLVTLVLKGFCLVDCALRPKDAFPIAEKQTKVFWLIILAIAFVWNLFVASPLNLINLAGIVAALVYVLDVRPAVRGIGGGRKGKGLRRPPSDW
jgi:hypothetical protein